MFIVTLFTVAKGNNTTPVSKLNKMWDIPTIEYIQPFKSN